jgi:hypothetical protein
MGIIRVVTGAPKQVTCNRQQACDARKPNRHAVLRYFLSILLALQEYI